MHIDGSQSSLIFNALREVNTNNNCNNTCFSQSKKFIIEKNICIDDCSKDDTYIIEIDNICYKPSQSVIYTDVHSNGNTEEKAEENEVTEKMENNESTNVVENNVKTEKIENNDSTNVVENNEKTEKMENNESTNVVENNVKTEKTENNESTNVVENNESTNVVENNVKTEKMENNESTNVVENNVKTEKIENNESTNVVENNERTEIMENNESTNIVEMDNDKSTNVVENNVKTEKIENNDSTNVVENNVKTEKMDNDESTNVVENNEKTEKMDNDESTNVVENNEKTEKLDNDESTNVVENNEKTEKMDNDESTNIVENNEKTEKMEKNEMTEEMENKESTYSSEEKTEKGENINNNIITDVVQIFSSENFFKVTQQIYIESASKKDEIIKNIKNDLINGHLNSLLQNVTGGLKQDLVAKDNDIVYQITTSDNQKNNNYSNISTINLGECENILREKYNISDNLALIILKIDYYMPGILIPVIGYEIYHPTNKYQLDLNYCKDTLIKLNIPVSINEDKVFIHDPNSDYYNDECYTYTTDNGTDILINDRQNEYIDNNLSLCENNCTFIGYEQNTKKAICECETKPKIGLISDIIKDENILANDFNYTDDSTSNIATMKCIDTLFSKEGLLTNIGSYLLLFTLVFYAISVIIFYKCGYFMIEEKINEIVRNKKKNTKNTKITNINKINSKKKKIRNNKHKATVKTVNKLVKTNKKKKIHLLKGNPLKKPSKNIINKKKNITKEKDYSFQSSSSKLHVKSIDIRVKLGKKSNNHQTIKKEVKIYAKKTIQYTDCELNLFDYHKSIVVDKRSFFKYYSSLLLSKHIILFSFYPNNDYNVKIIKMSIFFLSIDIFFAVNTLFFNEEDIHQIYSDGGVYNFSYFIPQIIYVFIISYVIIGLIRYFTLSERLLIEIKNDKNNKKIMIKVNSAKKCLNAIYITFYVLCFVLLALLWFYLSSFCAVYKNSQIFVFENTCIDLGISILYPLVYNLLPASLRIIALSKEIRNELIFNISKFLQLL